MLGQWQLHRAAYKQAIEDKIVAREAQVPVTLGTGTLDIDKLEYRRVKVVGELVRGWPVYLENRPNNGVPGFYLLMPLKIDGTGMHVLIARGWFPVNAEDRNKLPTVVTPAGTVTVEGIARRNPGRLLQLGQGDPVRPNAILQNVQIAEIAAASKLPMLPVFIEQTNDVHDGLVRQWPRPSSGIERHYGYAVQWFGLALTALIFFIVTGIRSESKQ
jgi:cytochrome oxidase assembly protein ShyY1